MTCFSKLLPGGPIRQVQAILEGENAKACLAFAEVAAIGERFGERDLITLARQGQGRALIRLGEFARGIGLLDEVMIAITAGEVSPLIMGDLYCSVIEAADDLASARAAADELTPDRGPPGCTFPARDSRADAATAYAYPHQIV
ncbi:MAG TPA: hypothetical protein VH763_00270 [Gemmatimonadales bacterium]